MPSPSPNWQTVPVFATYRLIDGTPHSGKIRFTVSTRVSANTDDIIFPAGGVIEALLDDTGHFTVDLPAVDDTDNSPSGWSIKVEERLDAGGGLIYYIQPSLSMLPTGLDLRGITLDDTNSTPVPATLRGVAGGLAPLDGDGDVTDAAGVKITPTGAAAVRFDAVQTLSSGQKSQARSNIDAASTADAAVAAGAAQKSANLSDLASRATARANLGTVAFHAANPLVRQHTRSARQGAICTDIVSSTLNVTADASLTKVYTHPISGITSGQARALTTAEIAAMPFDPGQGRPQTVNISGTGYGINSPTSANIDLASQTLWPFIAQCMPRMMFDGDKLDVVLYNGGVTNNTYQVFIDGAPLYAAPQAVAGGAGYLHLVLPSAKVRLIEIRTNCYVGNVSCGPLYTTWKPAPLAAPRVFVLGASYVAPTVWNGTTGVADKYQYGMWQQIGDWLDVEDVWTDGVSGSGFLTAGGGVGTPNNKFSDRAQGIINSAPDGLIVADAFINDLFNSQTPSNIATAANTFFNTIRAALPKCKIIVYSGNRAPLLGDLASGIDSCITALQALRSDLYYINSGRWITMAGYTPGHTTGGGNSDIYIGNDGIHPTVEGHAFLRARVAAILQRILADNGVLVNTVLT